MNWTKIPTNLLVDRIPDKELVAIVKYQLLWAELEYQPSDETVLRYLTSNQLKLINHWLDTIETQVVSDLKSVNKHRIHQKTNYQKKQQVKKKTDSQTDSQTDTQTDSSLTGNRLDKIRKENTNINICKKEVTKNIWNAIAQRWGLAEIRALTDDREKKLKLRLKEQNMTLEQFFDEIRTALEDSPFLRGKRWHEIAGHPDDSYWEDTDWRADFDFFLQPSSLQKAIEGKYADPTLRKERQRNQK